MNGSCDAGVREVGLWTGWGLADREAYAAGGERLREITGLGACHSLHVPGECVGRLRSCWRG